MLKNLEEAVADLIRERSRAVRTRVDHITVEMQVVYELAAGKTEKQRPTGLVSLAPGKEKAPKRSCGYSLKLGAQEVGLRSPICEIVFGYPTRFREMIGTRTVGLRGCRFFISRSIWRTIGAAK